MRVLTLLPVLFGLPSFGVLISREFPHLIVPVDANSPNTAYGTQKIGNITQTRYTEVSFDVPSNGANWCQLQFYLNVNKTKGAPWTLYGQAPYQFNISSLPPTINKDTDSWNSRPVPIATVGTVTLSPTGGTNITGGGVYPCPKGQAAQFLLHPASDDRIFGLDWFELDYPASEGGPHGIVLEMYS